eukprot:TRINITY_DN31529_c0_g1_i1.p1 TRINITY_DN31529_c0_g1~~TRINITY_DN31529_c0_g1_i1.p1  ORF type:complete len:196 (-),score=27.35 TRINITY_DN31529_c0_g1_i1:25-612(-)
MQFRSVAAGLLLMVVRVDCRFLSGDRSGGPLTSGEKQAVGEALTDALRAIQNHGGGNKYSSCASLFPDGRAPSDLTNPTWLACKDLVAPKRSALTAIVSAGRAAPFTYSKEEYKKDWQTEHRNDEYPSEAEGKWHHPEYSEDANRDPHPGTSRHERFPRAPSERVSNPSDAKSQALSAVPFPVFMSLMVFISMRV